MSGELDDPYRPNATWSAIRAAARILFKTTLRFGVRGLEHLPRRGGGLLLSNHQSFLDPVLIGTAFPRPVSFLARRTLFDAPVVGSVLRNTYVIPLDQQAVSPSSIKEAIRRMQQGYLVGIFPEGSRTFDGGMVPFQPGFLTLVRRGGVPVIPVGIAGAFESYPRGTTLPRPATVRMVVGPALDADAVALLAERRNAEYVALASARVHDCHEAAEHWRRTGREPTPSDP